MNIEETINELAVFESPAENCLVAATDVMCAINSRMEICIQDINLHKADIANIMSGGGCSSENWDDALERSDEIIALFIKCLEKNGLQ